MRRIADSFGQAPGNIRSKAPSSGVYGRTAATGVVRASRVAAAEAFSPSDIAGLAGWYKGDVGVFQTSGGAASGDGDPVGEWQDQSGNARHIVQATAGLRPTLRTNALNSLPAVDFDGTDDYLEYTTFPAMTSHTFFIVMKIDGDFGGLFANPLMLGTTDYLTAGTEFCELYQNTSGGIVHVANYNTDTLDVDSTTSTGTTDYHLICSRKDNAGGGTSTAYFNGTSEDTGTGNQVVKEAVMDVGSWFNCDLNGRIAELIIYDSALSDANRDLVESYIATRYGLTIA